jgi:hypothetical protein
MVNSEFVPQFLPISPLDFLDPGTCPKNATVGLALGILSEILAGRSWIPHDR